MDWDPNAIGVLIAAAFAIAGIVYLVMTWDARDGERRD